MDTYRGAHVSYAVTLPGDWKIDVHEDGTRDVGDLVVKLRRVREGWQRLHAAAQARCQRDTGARANVLLRVWEPQKRGAPHVHVVVGADTNIERVRAAVYGRALAELGGRHGFGFVFGYGLRGNRKVYSNPRSAARYVAGYFIQDGRNGKPSLTESARYGVLPQRPVWVNRHLTAASGVSMRNLRLARRVWAYRRGLCAAPREWIEVGQDYENHAVWKMLGGFSGLQRARAARAP